MKSASGKFVLRLPPRLHSILRERSIKKGVSLNRFCSDILETSQRKAASSPPPTADEMLIPRSLVLSCREAWKDELLGLALFGSAARGEMRGGSDVDLLIVLRPTAELSRQRYADWDKLSAPLLGEAEINPQFVRLHEEALDAGGLWYEVAIDGKILYEWDFEITRFLGKIRDAMARGEISRKISHGHPYWVKHFSGDKPGGKPGGDKDAK